MSMPDQTTKSLHDLQAEHDKAWEEFKAIPQEEVRAYWDMRTGDHEPEGRVADSFAKMNALVEQIEAHPDARDFEADLREVLGERIADGSLAGAVYGALCNVEWRHKDGARYSCSWRYAGGLVAEIRNEAKGLDEEHEDAENYMSWYCSGGEGGVRHPIDEAMATKGWRHNAL